MRTDKPLTLYWLSNDLMWIIYRTIQNAPLDLIWCGVESSIQYLKDLEVSPEIMQDASLIGDLLIQGKYGLACKYIGKIKEYLHTELLKQEPEFKKLGLRRAGSGFE